MTLYNCKSEIGADSLTRYRITKFDENMEVESSYLLDEKACGCPAGHRESCRHREMLPKFLTQEAVNTFLFLDHASGEWVDMNPEPKFIDEASSVPDSMWELPPDSVAVSTGDFDSPSVGSNPAQAANKDDLHALHYQACEAKFTRRF